MRAYKKVGAYLLLCERLPSIETLQGVCIRKEATPHISERSLCFTGFQSRCCFIWIIRFLPRLSKSIKSITLFCCANRYDWKRVSKEISSYPNSMPTKLHLAVIFRLTQRTITHSYRRNYFNKGWVFIRNRISIII